MPSISALAAVCNFYRTHTAYSARTCSTSKYVCVLYHTHNATYALVTAIACIAQPIFM